MLCPAFSPSHSSRHAVEVTVHQGTGEIGGHCGVVTHGRSRRLVVELKSRFALSRSHNVEDAFVLIDVAHLAFPH